MPCGMGKLSPSSVSQAVRMYAAGTSAERIAQRLSCSEKTVRNHLVRAGVELRGHGPLSADELARCEVSRVPRLQRALEALEAAGYEVRLRKRDLQPESPANSSTQPRPQRG
jgi:biotin operon repressor